MKPPKAIRIRNTEGKYLADDIREDRWTDDLSEAAEYDSEAGALRDIEGCGLMDCEIVVA